MDDLSDIYAAFGGAPSAPSMAVANPAPAGPGDSSPPLTVSRSAPLPTPSPTGGASDDLSDLHAAFATPTPARKPAASMGATAKDVAESAGSGLVRGAAGAAFAPASIAKMGADAIIDGGDWLVRKAFGLGPASQATKDAQAAGMEHRPFGMPSALDVGDAAQQALTPILHTPTTTPGKYAETIGEFAPMVAVNPESLANLGTVGGAAAHVGAGVVAPAVASEAAGQATQGTAYEPYARALGGIAGGVGAGVAGAGLGAAAHVAEPVVAKGLAAVGAPGMQERLAGQALMQGAQDPIAFRDALTAAPAQDQIVPGSQPTTFQLTGDQGIGAMERGDRTNNPAPYQARAQDQNTAQVAAINSAAPTGDATAVPAHLNDELAKIDAAAQQQIGAKTATAQDAAAQIGIGAGPEAVGADLRGNVQAANDAAKASERSLWKAVDPDGTLTNPTSAITDSAEKVYGSLSPTAQAFISPAEKTFAGLIQDYKPVEPFQQVADLRSNLAAAMRQELMTSGKTPAYARMSQLMGSVQDTINNAIEGRAAQEAQGVAQGVVEPAYTMAGRLQERQNQLDAAQQTVARTVVGGASGEPAGAQAGTVSGVAGAGVAPGRGSSRAAGNPSLPSDPLQANFDDGAAGRLRAASAATRENAQTFGKGPVGDVLRSGGTSGSYRLHDSAVPAKMFAPGPRGYETVKAYHAAAGIGPAATSAMQSAAMESLRSKAIGADGMVNPAGLAQWKRQYGNALRGIDEQTPGFSSKFDTAAKASDAVLAETRARDEAMKAYQAGAVGKIMGAGSADEVTNRLGTVLAAPDRVSQVRRLVEATRDNPDAAAGLRKGFADAMAKQFTSLRESGTSGERQIKADAYRKLIEGKSAALEQVFGASDMANFRAVADDLDRNNRSIDNKASAGPGTAGDLKAAEKAAHGGHGSPTSFLGAVVGGALVGGEAHGGEHGPLIGAALGGGAYLLNTLRAAGIRDVQHMVSDALLNPDRARQYIKRVSPNAYREQRLAGIVRQSFMNGDDKGSQDRIEPTIEPLPPAPGSRGNAISVAKPADIEAARAQVNPAPTPAQAEAGNYRKGHVEYEGMPISIENPRGSVRSGVGPDGKPWSTRMPGDYGYFKGSVGADGDHVDTYLGPKPPNGKAYVIDQVDPATGKFDEHKVILGVNSPTEAQTLYKRGFSDGSGTKRIGGVTEVPTSDLKEWLASGPQKTAFADRATSATTPDLGMARAEAAIALGRQFSRAGLDRHSISQETGRRAVEAIKAGSYDDHGRALYDAAIGRTPQEIKDAVERGSAPTSGGASAGESSSKGDPSEGKGGAP